MSYIPETEMRWGNVPCWYELSWDLARKQIIISIHKDFLKSVPVISNSTPLVKGVFAEIGISSAYFSGDFLIGIGSGGQWPLLKNIGTSGDFIKLSIPIPSVTICKCLFCSEDNICNLHLENKKETIANWKYAYNISASLTVLFRILSLSDKPTSSVFQQLMTVNTITQMGMHGGSLSCLLSKKVIDWLAVFLEKGGREITEVVDTLSFVYKEMLGDELYGERFYVRVERDERLIMTCPGDACDLGPECNLRKGEGYRLHPHNIDNPFQQITFLAGLAALHDKIRNA